MSKQCTGSECILNTTSAKTGTAISITLGPSQTIAGLAIISQYDVNIAPTSVGPDKNTIARLQIRTNIAAKLVGYGGKGTYTIFV